MSVHVKLYDKNNVHIYTFGFLNIIPNIDDDVAVLNIDKTTYDIWTITQRVFAYDRDGNSLINLVGTRQASSKVPNTIESP